MANYSLVLDTRFNPFSYDELIKPALMQTQAHQAIEEEYSNLAQKANIWDKLADEQTDSLAYTIYKNYSNDLSAKADQLLREGLNASSRKGMLDMRARYSKEITPIENAYNRRKELADEQRKAMAADPTLRYQNYANRMSLDDFIRNPSLDYGASYSGALLTKQVSQAVEGYKKYLTHKGDLSRLGLPAQYERELRNGAAPDVVMSLIYNRAIQGTDPDAIAFLNGVVENVLDASGVRRWADTATMRDYEGFARQGLYNAIGSVDLKNYTDTAGIQAMRNAGGRDGRDSGVRLYNPRPRNLYSEAELNENSPGSIERLLDERRLGSYRHYFSENNRMLEDTIRQIEEYMNYQPTGGFEDYGHHQMTNLRDFIQFAQNNGLVINQSDDGRYTVDRSSIRTFNNNFQNIINNPTPTTPSSTTLNNVEVYEIPIRREDRADLVDYIHSRITDDGSIARVGRINQDGTIAEGESVSMENFLEEVENSPIQGFLNYPLRNQVMIELINGKKFLIPETIFDNISREHIREANRAASAPGVSTEEAFTNINTANSYITSLLNYAEGEDYNYNDATTVIPIIPQQ